MSPTISGTCTRAAATRFTISPRGSFGQLIPYELLDELAERIDTLAPDLVSLGQYLDFLRNTAFLVSLICPAEKDIC